MCPDEGDDEFAFLRNETGLPPGMLGPDDPEYEIVTKLCDCGRPGTHQTLPEGWNAHYYRCCRCYVLAGYLPHKGHPECMATYAEMHRKESP